jgi:hypothetical protein
MIICDGCCGLPITATRFLRIKSEPGRTIACCDVYYQNILKVDHMKYYEEITLEECLLMRVAEVMEA